LLRWIVPKDWLKLPPQPYKAKYIAKELKNCLPKFIFIFQQGVKKLIFVMETSKKAIQKNFFNLLLV